MKSTSKLLAFLTIASILQSTNRVSANKEKTGIPPYVICREGDNGKCRMFPTLYLIGCGRCGSTSLYSMLVPHADINDGTILEGESEWISKEIGYWGNNAAFPDQDWYLNHFPVDLNNPELPYLRTMDATPSYASIAKIPQRMIETTPPEIVPHMRFIEVLRDPVDRFVSYFCQILEGQDDWAGWVPHLTHEGALGLEQEQESLIPLVSQAIDAINTCLAKHPDPLDNIEQMRFNWCVRGKNAIFKIVVDGLYLRQLLVWSSYFTPEQFMLLATQDLKPGDPDRLVSVTNAITDFTGIRREQSWQNNILGEYGAKNGGKGKRCSKRTVPASAVEQLSEFYRSHNAELVHWATTNRDRIGSIDDATIAHMKSWGEESRTG